MIELRISNANAASQVYGNLAKTDEIRSSTAFLREETDNRIDEMKKEIALLIAEYDEENDTSWGRSLHKEPLSDSIRMIKIKNA